MAHLLHEITIINFKSVQSCHIPLTSFTPIVGYNNSGKSNVINAIKWLLRKSLLPLSDFNDITQPIVVEGKITGITPRILSSLTPAHNTAIQRYVTGGILKLKRTQAPNVTGIAGIRLELFDSTTSTWGPPPTGIENALSALFPEPIHIGAMENAEDDVSKNRTTTTIGKLISEIVEPIERKYTAKANQAFSKLKNVLDADGTRKAHELKKFDSEVNKKIDSFFPHVKVKIHVPLPELKELFKTGTIKVYESTIGRDISSYGHGSQRSVQMALIRQLADTKKATNAPHTNTLLLIDEPELYLHPQAIEQVRQALKELTNKGYQVVFSTHSPIMISADEIADAVLINKTNVGTQRRPTVASAISSLAVSSKAQFDLLMSFSNSAQLLFCNKAVVVEGKTEKQVLPDIFEKISKSSLLYNKYALVPIDGVTNSKKTMDVLNALQIPCKTIVDLDYVFTTAHKDGFLLTTDTDILACKTILSTLKAIHGFTLTNGLPSGSSGRMSPKEVYELLASDAAAEPHIDSIHRKLLSQNIWVWKKGAIEKHLGITAKTDIARQQFRNNLKRTRRPASVINDIAEVTGLINWILS